MNVTAIDHVNLRIPEGEVDDAIEFYEDSLGAETENLTRYESGEKPFFSFRLTEMSVVHIRPVADFKRPSGQNYDHLALLVKDSLEDLKQQLVDAGIDVLRESEPLGATGVAPAIYVQDPFGYIIEIKEDRLSGNA
ncbi:lactoylglutathione lyase (plasmid) [Salinigranum rubrum]|uniref:Lactoylglutathione lyase n=1 Tax=Salinigranum rubrum TaxID=755307 RepID=A0A2I8VQB4_9EURY|nr:VOC family protein [Salinigranum rubrum]AUV84086.1 lactoylglutathione lyase [Salinigranum rubrum]